jgi:ATP-dependent helicase YprA (DUF1998 family)
MRIPQIIATARVRTGGLDEVKRDLLVTRFREAFEADVDEEVRADMIYELNRSMWGQPAMYMAVGEALGSRYKNLIREYVKQVADRSKGPRLGCDCDDGCSKCIPSWI